jgi:hypothetical protein
VGRWESEIDIGNRYRREKVNTKKRGLGRMGPGEPPWKGVSDKNKIILLFGLDFAILHQ